MIENVGQTAAIGPNSVIPLLRTTTHLSSSIQVPLSNPMTKYQSVMMSAVGRIIPKKALNKACPQGIWSSTESSWFEPLSTSISSCWPVLRLSFSYGGCSITLSNPWYRLVVSEAEPSRTFSLWLVLMLFVVMWCDAMLRYIILCHFMPCHEIW